MFKDVRSMLSRVAKSLHEIDNTLRGVKEDVKKHAKKKTHESVNQAFKSAFDGFESFTEEFDGFMDDFGTNDFSFKSYQGPMNQNQVSAILTNVKGSVSLELTFEEAFLKDSPTSITLNGKVFVPAETKTKP
jgi:hypothetical protein